jgi:hypothetical protein
VISLNWKSVEGEIGSLMQRFAELPRHIAKKHLQAAMKRALKIGVPVLKKNTPKGGTKTVRSATTRNARGQFTAGSGKLKKVRGGALRRAVTTKSKYVGKNKDGFVVGTLGYKGGTESRKAIWLEFGTTRGLEARKMVERSMSQIGPQVSAKLAAEMALALEKSAAEVAAKKNLGYQGGK